jgi:hypothetical protein
LSLNSSCYLGWEIELAVAEFESNWSDWFELFIADISLTYIYIYRATVDIQINLRRNQQYIYRRRYSSYHGNFSWPRKHRSFNYEKETYKYLLIPCIQTYPHDSTERMEYPSYTCMLSSTIYKRIPWFKSLSTQNATFTNFNCFYKNWFLNEVSIMDKIYYIYILNNVSSSHMIVTHYLKTTFWESATFYFSY